ncbi:unnamed protein product [Heterobilharzia americana]|nr:unnamed protein product [Heterobilharzia americana]
MCPEAAVAQIISSIRHTVKNSSSYSFKSNLTGVIIYLPCIDILIESIPQLTANYFIDNLIALLNEINCELNYIPSFFNTLQTTTNDLNDSIINKQKLLYATLRSSCRVVIVGTCTHRQRYTSTTINSSKQQYNSNLINTKPIHQYIHHFLINYKKENVKLLMESVYQMNHHHHHH